jgi:hypothetical protein
VHERMNGEQMFPSPWCCLHIGFLTHKNSHCWCPASSMLLCSPHDSYVIPNIRINPNFCSHGNGKFKFHHNNKDVKQNYIFGGTFRKWECFRVSFHLVHYASTIIMPFIRFFFKVTFFLALISFFIFHSLSSQGYLQSGKNLENK